jgi:hypothetical protein
MAICFHTPSLSLSLAAAHVCMSCHRPLLLSWFSLFSSFAALWVASWLSWKMFSTLLKELAPRFTSRGVSGLKASGEVFFIFIFYLMKSKSFKFILEPGVILLGYV